MNQPGGEQQQTFGGPLLQDKVAVITGAGSGIGRAAALRFAGSGAHVCLLDLKNDRTEQVEEEIRGMGREALFCDVDVANPQRVEQAIRSAAERFGRIDIVFANAGINGTLAPIEDLTPEDWDKTLTTNLKGTFLTVKYAIPHMKQAGGSIIVTSSVNGSRVFSNFGMTAYSASKAGQIAFAKMAALELARYKIRVNVICPGAVETNIGENTHPTQAVERIRIPVEYPEGGQPLEHRPAKPEQVADLVLFLASEQSSHISGTEVFIDGAETLL
ncbi:SDR family NAD(P)-dependent oxidoreductase [Cohnella lubricantis]|uniref:SDR family oxidoreductase n=1 Tax=Cohnella lubricantis TaxID=2163172 RepID=A0A841TFE5_9BACL|nr:SDR family NAD(P)-dependent oxidoreductase [Cohnella lubricantis]MBB6678008.1 SDR family oxidoreductase [Cohnella lubricantis]MBP2118159.1 NAD(P)-dependent dehydrogenase (short-subunit alcohol dehydrogenase family) [Cohnella lubricantis]